MNTTRVSMLRLEEAMSRAEEIGVGGQLASLNVFRVLLRRPRVAKATADLLLELLSGGALGHRLRELVIMRVGWATGSAYEWTQHWTLAQQLFALSPEDLLAVRDWQRAGHLGEPERIVLGATDEVLATGTMSESACARCRTALGDDALVELVLVVGVWRAVSELTRSLDIALEEGVDPWPPDGAQPR